jgi:hypothetical protein
VHQQQLQLAQVLARVRAEEADIVSRVSMLQIEQSKPSPANADHAPTLGEHARAGAPVHEPEPVIPLAVVRRIQASREEYVRSLQVLSLLALLVQKYNYCRIQASREEYVRSLQVLSLLALLVQKYNY